MRILRINIALVIAVLFLTVPAKNKAQTSPMTIIGDSLVGKVFNGEKIREVIGNVVIKDNDATVTCDKAVQFLESGNIALYGNIVFTQDTIKLYTDRARYFGESKTGVIDTNLLMISKSDSIFALKGKHLFNEKKTFFYGDVRAKSKLRTLISDTLIYSDKNKITIAIGNAKAIDSVSVLFADSLVYFEEDKITQAFGNVCLKNDEHNTIAVADFLLDSVKTLHSVLWQNSAFMQTDSTEKSADTLLVEAKRFDVFRDSSRQMIARDSVKIVRDEFSLIADSAFFDSDKNFFVAVRTSEERNPVVLWFRETQIYGDTVFVFLENKTIKNVKISGNVSLIENVDSSKFRFNQISGRKIDLYFADSRLRKMEVNGKTLNIYYLTDDEGTQGLIKSSSNSATIVFDSSGVAQVKLFGNPNSEFHPEKLIRNKERDFLLPSFKIFGNKPSKEKLLQNFFKKGKTCVK